MRPSHRNQRRHIFSLFTLHERTNCQVWHKRFSFQQENPKTNCKMRKQDLCCNLTTNCTCAQRALSRVEMLDQLGIVLSVSLTSHRILRQVSLQYSLVLHHLLLLVRSNRVLRAAASSRLRPSPLANSTHRTLGSASWGPGACQWIHRDGLCA